MKSGILFLIRLIGLTVVYFICFAVVSGLVFPVAANPDAEQGNPAAALLVVSLLNTAALAYLIRSSQWAGWKLVLAVFIVMFGIVTVMPQIETAYFVTRLPPGMLARIFVAGAIVAAAFSLLAVPILGRSRHSESDGYGASVFRLSVSEWACKLALIVVIYEVIYFTFGYFIAWQSAAVRAYYGGNDPQGFFIQMGQTVREMPWLLPLQAVRAMLWAGLAVLIIRMLRRSWLESGLLVAMLFAIVMNTQLLIPNPFMPREVRMVHLLETATSNFLFGSLLVLVLSAGSRDGSNRVRLSAGLPYGTTDQS